MSKRDLQRRLDYLWRSQSAAERGRFLVAEIEAGRRRPRDLSAAEWDDVDAFIDTGIPGWRQKMQNVPDEVLDAIAEASQEEAVEILAAYIEDTYDALTAPKSRPEPGPESLPEPKPEPETQPELEPAEPEPEPEPISEPDPPNLTLRYFGSRSFLLKDDAEGWAWHVMPDDERAFPAAEARALAARVPDLEVVE